MAQKEEIGVLGRLFGKHKLKPTETQWGDGIERHSEASNIVQLKKSCRDLQMFIKLVLETERQ